MSWVSAAEFARRMGCSKANVTLSIKSGRIEPKYVRRSARGVQISTECLPYWQATATVHDTLPLVWASQQPCQKTTPSPPDWQAIAERLNDYLGRDWPGPPWSADQTATLAVCLGLAVEGDDAAG